MSQHLSRISELGWERQLQYDAIDIWVSIERYNLGFQGIAAFTDVSDR